MSASAQVPQTVELGMPNGAHRFYNGTNRDSAGRFEVHQTGGEWMRSSELPTGIFTPGDLLRLMAVPHVHLSQALGDAAWQAIVAG